VSRPTFKNSKTALVAGVALFLAGSYCLHDAWEGHGRPTPKWARPFTWW
jgi:hypothetical protein